MKADVGGKERTQLSNRNVTELCFRLRYRHLKNLLIRCVAGLLLGRLLGRTHAFAQHLVHIRSSQAAAPPKRDSDRIPLPGCPARSPEYSCRPWGIPQYGWCTR